MALTGTVGAHRGRRGEHDDGRDDHGQEGEQADGCAHARTVPARTARAKRDGRSDPSAEGTVADRRRPDRLGAGTIVIRPSPSSAA